MRVALELLFQLALHQAWFQLYCDISGSNFIHLGQQISLCTMVVIGLIFVQVLDICPCVAPCLSLVYLYVCNFGSSMIGPINFGRCPAWCDRIVMNDSALQIVKKVGFIMNELHYAHG